VLIETIKLQKSEQDQDQGQEEQEQEYSVNFFADLGKEYNWLVCCLDNNFRIM